MSDTSIAIQNLNRLIDDMKARGWIVEGTGKIRDPEEALEIENRWLRRKIARLQRSAQPSPPL